MSDLEVGNKEGSLTKSNVSSNSDLENAKKEESMHIPAFADPFARREGKSLVWRDVNMTLKGVKGGEDKKLLDGVWGEVPSGQTTAVMGPSGAGKSSLLNILAGRASSKGRVKIASDVRFNNHSVDPTNIHVRQHIAFVAQDDSLQVTSTPREAIYFSAKLRLARSTPDATIRQLVNKILLELGLSHCADTYVGGALLKGISGGERKRTSVGVELVVRPAMVFLDEPTSGLDSFSAVQLCQVLKKVANAGASVLFTIHQPSSEIFNSFDRLVLLNKGRVMYNGLVEDVADYFGERGQPLPAKYNPADWIMNVAQAVPLDELDKNGFFIKDERDIPEPFNKEEEGKDELGLTVRTTTQADGHVEDSRMPGFFTQISLLFSRELKNIYRDKTSMGARMGNTVLIGVITGIIFLNVGATDSSVAANITSHFGALTILCMGSMMGSAQPALLAFPDERPVFLREYSTNHYSVVAYFMSRLSSEAIASALQMLFHVIVHYYMIDFTGRFGMFFLTTYLLAMASSAVAVMIGCAIEDPKIGQEMMPIMFVPQMLFAGFFVRPELIPQWLRWPRYLCSLTYALRILLVEEFGHGCGGGDADLACEAMLEEVDADPDETWWNWLCLFGLFVFFRLTALVVLRQKAVKFL
eukprot:Nitzschia sp. Nitz4//scaffold27_size158506//133304//135455//NITZ4_002621-RA/size158506-processed-gene-0.89-mRNA-1//-1//CDS//3329545551//5115//frame0